MAKLSVNRPTEVPELSSG